MKYFEGCVTLESVKKRFKELCKKLHPDNGGSEDEFKEMMVQYQAAFVAARHFHENAGEACANNVNFGEMPEWIFEIIKEVVLFDGVIVEIMGTWIWLTGKTFPYKDQIKALGFFWSGSKRAWYHKGPEKEEVGKRPRGHNTLNEIRGMFGSQKVKGKGKGSKKETKREVCPLLT